MIYLTDTARLLMIFLMQGSHTFSYASFQDISRSKLRFSRTVICGKKCFRRIVIFKKYLDSNFICILKDLTGSFQDIVISFPFFRTFPGLEIHFFILQVSQMHGNPVMGTSYLHGYCRYAPRVLMILLTGTDDSLYRVNLCA